MSSTRSAASTELHVPFPDVVRFIRQLSHDLRNHLNAAELQAAYIKEIADNPEIKDELQRLRAMVSELGNALQKLTGALAPVKLTLMPYEASAFIVDLQQKVGQQFADLTGTFDWAVQTMTGKMEIDPQLLQQAMLELLDNALHHGRGEGKISITAETANEQFVLTVREPKAQVVASTEHWGREPFKQVKHGHYGLGLQKARSTIEAHGGSLSAQHDAGASALVSTVSIPLAHG
ncbi:hypothetical protein BH18VER1_BH18VER1_09540 [soil metagenome]